ncbi:MAG: amidohydrolase [Sphingobium sp.]
MSKRIFKGRLLRWVRFRTTGRAALLLALPAALYGCQAAREQPAPPILFDTHSHFFSDDIARYPIDTTGAKEGAEALRQRVMAKPSTPENILALWSANNLEGGTGVQYNSTYKTDNSYLIESADAHPARISAVVILDARDAETPAKLRKLVEQHGVRGIRLTGYPLKNGSYPWLDSPEALRTWQEADRLGISIVIMYLPGSPSAEALGHIAALSDRYRNVKIVLDHVGWPGIEGAPGYGLTPAHVALHTHPNVYMKFTTINLNNLDKGHVPSAEFVRHVVDVFGADHVMWGSDYGNTGGQFSDMARRAVEATRLLNPTERKSVLHDTGRTIFPPPGDR